MNILTEGSGYVILDNVIPESLIDNINVKLDTLVPVRASSIGKLYAEKEDITNLPDIAVWWSQLVMDWPEVIEIENIVHPFAKQFLEDMVWYTSDIVTIASGSNWINPHVDTPHRFTEWNEDERLLGIQCIVALQDMEPESGVTGLVPESYKQDWYINQCYSGEYDKYFMDRYVQEKLPKGSVLMYNCRLLHSSMPNYLPKPRPALLINYLSGAIVKTVMQKDNVWNSNV